MAVNKIPDYSTTAATNTDIGGVSIAEGFPATNINASERQLLAQLKTECALRSSVASATTVDISTSGAYDITGTTTITTFTIGDGTQRLVTFLGVLTLTHNASNLICPGGANITTAAGDTAIILGIGSNQARVAAYQRAAAVPAGTLIATERCQGRLTLVSGVPIPATGTDSTVSTLYWTPYKGNQIAVYNGTSWQILTFAEMSIAVPATTNTNYDVFFDYNSGTPQLSLTAWSGDTTRATALAFQDGIYVLSGTPTKRYLGTARTGTSSGTFVDTSSSRLLWNYYNRVQRQMFAVDTTDSWTYSTAAWRQANGAATNQVSLVQGLTEDIVDATVVAVGQGSTTAVTFYVGIGKDSTTVNSAQILHLGLSSATNSRTLLTANYRGTVGNPGYHYLAWIEQGAGAGTETFYGDNGAAISQSGMNVTCWC